MECIATVLNNYLSYARCFATWAPSTTVMFPELGCSTLGSPTGIDNLYKKAQKIIISTAVIINLPCWPLCATDNQKWILLTQNLFTHGNSYSKNEKHYYSSLSLSLPSRYCLRRIRNFSFSVSSCLFSCSRAVVSSNTYYQEYNLLCTLVIIYMYTVK